MFCILDHTISMTSTGCIPANTAHLKHSLPVPLILTTALRVCIQSDGGTNAQALNGSRCHNDSYKETKCEKTQPEPFCSYTSMKFNNSWRSTSLRGGGASTYTATIFNVIVTGGCVTGAGSTALWKTTSTAIWKLYVLRFCWRFIITGLKTMVRKPICLPQAFSLDSSCLGFFDFVPIKGGDRSHPSISIFIYNIYI